MIIMKMTFEKFIKKYGFEKANEVVYEGDFEDESVDIYKWPDKYVMKVYVVCCDIKRIFVCHDIEELHKVFKENVNLEPSAPMSKWE